MDKKNRETVRVNVYLDLDIRKRSVEQAKKMGLTFSAFVNLALYEFIKQDSVIQLADMYKRMLSEAQSGSDSD
jgi:post-segregation antitoxin (ccd killing protein)